MIRIRVDDFPWTKREERDNGRHTIENFNNFMATLDHYEIVPLVGVIPGNCDQNDLSYLRENNSAFEIGLHGIYHEEYKPNEFLPYLTVSDIEKQLKITRMLLEASVQKPIRTYMPPHNVIDQRTIGALRGAGFDSFTTGPETSSDIVGSVILDGNYNSLKVIHSQKPAEYGRSDELLTAGMDEHLNAKTKYYPERISTLTLHWTWETNIGLNHLEKFLDSIKHSLKRGKFYE